MPSSAMTRDELTALAGRVEKAEGPDWELECEIARACLDFSVADDEVPGFSRSLDAALTLVPGSRELNLRIYADGEGYAILDGLPTYPQARGRTAALALTAAALRALAALRAGAGGEGE